MTVDATSARKTALRRELRGTRRECLAGRDVDAEASALADQVTALVEGRTQGRVCRVAAYESLPQEPPTHLIIERLTASGHEVVVPVTLPDLDLDWQLLGATEPLGRDAIRDAEVVIAPALAVDRSGHRLGQGGGSYDRALARRHPDALIVVLLHEGELLPAGAVPADRHDVSVHVAVTPLGGTVELPSA